MVVKLIKSNAIEDVDISIPENDVNLNPFHIALLVRLKNQNATQGTKNTKGRSDVRGRSAKPYRQKGTGRARQGSTKAPHFRGGGVAHGPHPKLKRLKLNRKLKNNLLKNIIRYYALNQNLFFIDLDIDSKAIRNYLNGDKALLIYSIENKDKLIKARNLENLKILSYNSMSPEFLLDYHRLYFDNMLYDNLVDLFKSS